MHLVNRFVEEFRIVARLFSIGLLLSSLAATAPVVATAQTQSTTASGADSPGTISTSPIASEAERAWDQALANELVAGRNLLEARQNGANAATIKALQNKLDAALLNANVAWALFQSRLPDSQAFPVNLVNPAPAPNAPNPATASPATSTSSPATVTPSDVSTGTSSASTDDQDDEANGQCDCDDELEHAIWADRQANQASYRDREYQIANGHRDPQLAAEKATAQDAAREAWAAYHRCLDEHSHGECTGPINHYRELDEAIESMFGGVNLTKSLIMNERKKTEPAVATPEPQAESQPLMPPASGAPIQSLISPSKPVASSSHFSLNTVGGVQFQLRGFGGASIANGALPGVRGFDGTVLFPLNNRVLIGPSAGVQWIDSFIVNTVGGGPAPSTFIHTTAGFKNGNFGGQLTLRSMGGFRLGLRGGATVAHSTITQQEGFCGEGRPAAPSGCTVFSTTSTHDTVVGPFLGGYISHSIFNHVGVFVGYDYHRMKDGTSAGTGSTNSSISNSAFDTHYQNVVGGMTLTFGMHHEK